MKRLLLKTKNKYSAENALYLAGEVTRMEEREEDFDNPTAFDTVRCLAEELVWCDKNDEATFDAIMGNEIMNTLERIVTNAAMSSQVRIHVLNCVTLVLQNLSRVASIYFMCSNNHINRMIAIEFDESDDELLSIYISFLKSLALRLNKDTVYLFFDNEIKAFPLFSKAVKLLASQDAMVRTTARQIVLSVSQISEDSVAAYVDSAMPDVMSTLLSSVWSLIDQLGTMITTAGRPAAFPVEGTPTPAPVAPAPPISAASLLETLMNQWDATFPSAPTAVSSAASPNTKNANNSKQLWLSKLDTCVEDVMDDLLYLNDLCRIPHAHVAAQIADEVKQNFVLRLCQRLTREVTGSCGDEGRSGDAETGTTKSTESTLQRMPAGSLLFLLIKWIRGNEEGSPLVILRDCFLATQPKGGTAQGEANATLVPYRACALQELNVFQQCGVTHVNLLDGLLLSPRVDMHDHVLRFYQILLQDKKKSQASAAGSTTTASNGDATHRCRSVTAPQELAYLKDFKTPVQRGRETTDIDWGDMRLLTLAEFIEQSFWADMQATVKPHATTDASYTEMVIRIVALLTSLYYHITSPALCRISTLQRVLDLLRETLLLLGLEPPASQLVWTKLYAVTMRLMHVQLLALVQADAQSICEYRKIKEDLVTSEGFEECPTAHTGREESGGKKRVGYSFVQKWAQLCNDPYEILFLCMKSAYLLHDENAVRTCGASLVVSLILPQLPFEEAAAPTPTSKPASRWASATRAPLECVKQALTSSCMDGHACSFCSQVVDGQLALAVRMAAGRTELRYVTCDTWLMLRNFFDRIMYPSEAGEPRKSSPQTVFEPVGGAHKAGETYVYCQAEAPLLLRCEVIAQMQNGHVDPSITPGTPFYVLSSDSQLIFLQPPPNNAAQMENEFRSGICEREIKAALDISFLQARISTSTNFKVHLYFYKAGIAQEWIIVFRDQKSAREAVNLFNLTAEANRRKGAQLCFGLLHVD